MELFPKKCSKGHTNSPTASFCSECGEPLSGGEITCGACGTNNRSNANFCKKCGRALGSSSAPELHSNHWARHEQDFAARVDASDLQGLFKRGVIVEPGTNALLVDGGTTQATLGPGTYNLDSLTKRFADWFQTGIGSQVTALLVDVTPTDLDFAAGRIFTNDPLNIGVHVKLQAQVENPGLFLVNMLKGRERFTRTDLEGYLYPEVTQVLERWVGQHTVKELAEDFSLREKMELDLDEALKRSFKQSGLTFNHVRAVEINLEHLDRIKGITAKYALQISEADAELTGRVGVFNLQREGKLQEWAEETAKVEHEERKVALYERMRKAVMAGKMDEIRSDADFDTFLEEMDRGKLLREKDRADLLRTWKEEGEDKQRARAHLLAKLDMEQGYELKMADLRLSSAFNDAQYQADERLERMRTDRQFDIQKQKLDFEIDLDRKKADYEAEQNRKKRIADQEQADRELKLRQNVHGQDLQEMLDDLKVAQAGFDVLIYKRRQELEIAWEDERRRMDAQWARELKQLEIDLERERMRNQHELDRMEALGKLGTEALIAASPLEQGQVLADLKKNEVFKGMSEDQILALAAKDSPAVAAALAEKFKAMSDGKASAREREMYDKLLAEKESREKILNETWEKAETRSKETAERAMQSSEHAMDRMADVASSFARGQTPPQVIVTGPGGSQVINPSAAGQNAPSQAGQNKLCPECGQYTSVTDKHCPHCGHAFAGM